ncbi:hypothetical protein [Amycolatopsis alkalitolerans]|uniref:Uncharacterized protein n=1 Tax=Amycolatopsis alkalitolerans TaxID=2547244 RepID=A0A5C4LZA5_9PSEU|nr:hypothetical protein [Amycolatopsis alkalitolerans]TNC23419.1 hypothetical protein FG385_22050 [Amycolatopsis alkalitolerans]
MRTAARLIAGIAIMLVTGAGATQVATAAVPAPTVTIMAGASCVVTGYTLHAEEEMANDSITSDHVETVVHNYCSRARKQKNGRYKYTDGRITVIAERSGYVVTVWRN